MEFKEFLEENEKEHNESYDCVSIEVLGEWFWKRFKEGVEECDVVDYNWFRYDGYAYSHLKERFDIAIACLGENEINKRLKEMRK